MGRELCVIGPIYLLTKPKERQNDMGRQQGEGRGLGVGCGRGGYKRRDVWYVRVCKTSTSITTKSMMLQRLLRSAGSGRRALVFRVFVYSLFFFFACIVIYFTLFRWMVGFKIGVKALIFMSRCNLATAQHLCSTLVSFVNPGLVGVGLEEGTNAHLSNCCVNPISSTELYCIIKVTQLWSDDFRWWQMLF